MKNLLLSTICALLLSNISFAEAPIKFEGKISAPGITAYQIKHSKVYFFKPNGKSPDTLLGEGNVNLNPDLSFTAEYNPSDPAIEQINAEFYFESDSYAPITACSKAKRGTCSTEFKYGPVIKKKTAAHFTGLVVDGHNNSPIPYAGIYSDCVGTLLTRADANGKYEFWGTVSNGKSTITAFTLGYVGHTISFDAKSGGKSTINIPMEKGVRMKIKTVDLEGNPVSGVSFFFNGGGGGTCRTDAEGNGTSGNLMSAYRPLAVAKAEKKGWVLAEDPGSIIAGDFEETPLIIRMKQAE